MPFVAMTRVGLAFLVAGFASAQYTITDLIGHNSDQALKKNGAGSTQESAFGPDASAPIQAPHQNMQPRGWGEPVTPRPQTNTPVNAMSSLLGDLQGSMGSTPSPSNGAQNVNGKVLSEDSMAVVSGLVEAFMHKVHLEAGEKACLENNIQTLTGDVMGTVGDIVTAVKALIAGKGTVAKQSAGPLVTAGLDSAMKLTSLVTLSTQLMKNCVHGDALALLSKTGQHMVNGTYLQHRFLVNGVDIAHDLADSIIAFEAHNFRRFGTDIGTSLRKVLLSKATHATRLPEGVPEKTIIQQATDGLMKGFFVAGSGVEIKDTAHPDVDIRINLHQCIAGNSQFFKELWMSAWDLIAQLSANGIQGFNLGQNTGKGQPAWSDELMTAMMQFPMALGKCGVSSNMQSMLMEAIGSLKDLQVHFSFPEDRIQTQDAAKKISKAVEAWTNWDFELFGYELGKLFRELVMLTFPQKYSIDTSGRLQRYTEAPDALQRRYSFFASALVIGGAAVAWVLVSFAVIRTRRASLHLLVDQEAGLADVEDGNADAIVE